MKDKSFTSQMRIQQEAAAGADPVESPRLLALF